MTRNVLFRLTASGLALTTIGCSPQLFSQKAGTLVTPVAERGETKLYAEAQTAVQANRVPEALSLTEKLVEIAPRDAGYRLLLGDLYLKSGRFASAEAAFADVLRLDPSSSRASLSLALSQIAQGKAMQAQAELDRVSATAAPGDVGLAYAIAGRTDRALQLLETAARAPEADGRVRQNLALAHAIAGDWGKARVIASQDVHPAELDSRLAAWAALANPAEANRRVARLLGVEPAADPGLPVGLALQEEKPVEIAPAVIAPAAKPVEVAGYPAPAEPAPVQARLAAAVETLIKPDPLVLKTPVKIADAPIPAFSPVKAKPATSNNGRFVVQIGAYGSPALAKDAWGRAVRRFALDGSLKPHSTTVSLPGKGVLHRLSIAGFEAPAEAQRLCRSIRAKGGACFVRTRAGDSLAAWAGAGSGRG
jgi:Flp pilus assembly protein TadD